MLHFRRHPRVEVPGVTATIGGRSARVLNLSDGGMLIEAFDLPRDRELTFELHGPGLRRRGRGHVAHVGPAGTGIACERWSAPIRELQPLMNGPSAGEPYVPEWA